MTKRKFSKNEIKLLELISNGKTEKEIAEVLYISVNTVRNWQGKLSAVFNANNKAHLAAEAIRAGVIK